MLARRVSFFQVQVYESTSLQSVIYIRSCVWAYIALIDG